MKRILLIILLASVSIIMWAQNNKSTQQSASHNVPVDTTNKAILRQLIEIHILQEAERAERDSIRKLYYNNASQHNTDSAAVPSNEYGAMLRVADNTSFNGRAKVAWWVAILAFIVSAISMIYAKITYDAQKNTEINTKKAEENTKKAEENTKRVSQDAQRKLLNELLRHLYRNYVITYTMRTKMKDISYKGYPSEEHFEKLKIPMENIHLDVFYGEDEKFQLMHVLYLNLRNYNEEVEVALKHIIDPNLKRRTKDEDFDTLEFKVSYLTGRIIDTISKVWGDSPQFKDEMREAMQLSLAGGTNATDNIDVPKSEKFTKLSLDALKNTKYKLLYSEDELKTVCEIFNNDVHEERKKNARGAWKVRMIKY